MPFEVKKNISNVEKTRRNKIFVCLIKEQLEAQLTLEVRVGYCINLLYSWGTKNEI